MKIFYINVIEQNGGWGAECFVNRGFLDNGQETFTLDYRKHRRQLGARFLSLQTDFDVLFLQRGDWFPIDLLRAVNRPMFFWASELVSRNDDQDRLLKSGLFRHIFVHSQACRDAVIQNGWMPQERVSVLLNGFDDRVHRVKEGMEQDIDVLFVGHILPRRRALLDRLGGRFNVMEAKAFGDDMVDLFNRAKVVLNIHAEEYADTETRVFEALGCGAFLLTEKLSAENPFQHGVHLVEVEGIDAMEEALERYLASPAERQAIAAAGHAEALARHTYRCRAAELAEVFGAAEPAASLPPIDTALVRRYARTEALKNRLEGVMSYLRGSLRGRR